MPKTYPDDSGLVPMSVEHEMVQRRYERLMRELHRQGLDFEKRRGARVGDFWTADEVKRYFGRP